VRDSADFLQSSERATRKKRSLSGGNRVQA